MHGSPAPTTIIPSELLLTAYRAGVFPMADHRDDPEVFWVEPRERAVFPLEDFRVSKSLRKTIRQDRTCNFQDSVHNFTDPCIRAEQWAAFCRE